MNIEFTKEEFEKLLDLVYAGNLMVNGLRSYEERITEYSDLEQKIFKLTEEAGLKNVIEYDEEFKEYMPTREYEEGAINEYIDAYDDKVFWEELVVRLARRDALNELGDINPDMSKSELNQKQLDLEEFYEDEVTYHGLSRMKIVPLPIASVDK
ncbi:MAG: hypothetical protein AB9856_05815 [Cellulosilyticaceae bacterium]